MRFTRIIFILTCVLFATAFAVGPGTAAMSSESNNGLPDLVIDALYISPANPTPGEPITVRTTVRNQGPERAGPFEIRVYVDPAGEPDVQTPPDSLTGTFGLRSAWIFRWNWTGYRFDDPGAGHRIWAWVDPLGEVTESDEDNNLVYIDASGPCTPDGYANDLCDDATPLAMRGASVAGNLCPRGDEDWYTFPVQAGHRYTVTAAGGDRHTEGLILRRWTTCEQGRLAPGARTIVFQAPPGMDTAWIRSKHREVNHDLDTRYEIAVVSDEQDNPVPAITSLNPDSATAGGEAFTLTVNGTDFVSDAAVQWNRAGRPTTYVSSTRLTATITASDIVTPGSVPVTVFNPPPGGGTSDPLTFTVLDPHPNIATPTAVVTSLPEGESTAVPLTITNTGGVTLTFSIDKELGSVGAGGQGSWGEGEKGRRGEREKGEKGIREQGNKGEREQGDKGIREQGNKGEREKGDKGIGGQGVDSALWDALDGAPDGRVAFFVYLDEQADLRPAYAIRDWEARGEFVYRTLREMAQRSQKELLAELEAQESAGNVTSYRPFFIVNAVAVTGNRRAVEALAARPEVASLISDFGSLDRFRAAFRISDFPFPDQDSQPPTPNPQSPTSNLQPPTSNLQPPTSNLQSPTSNLEWNLRQIRADRVWDELGITGAGVVVASIDTGVDYAHPALANQYRGAATGRHDYNWYDPTGTYPDAPGDNHGHGTHVMGVMVGDDGADNRTGVAPGAQWIAAKGCAGDWWCTVSDLLAAAEWLLAPCPIGVTPGDAHCDPGQRPHVVNNAWNSLGGLPEWFEWVIRAWRAAGIFPVFSAGTLGPDESSLTSPGDYAASFAAGATDSADTICRFSGRGPSWRTPATKPDVVAPGCGGVRSALPGGGYAIGNDASASAHTAGVAALLRAASPDLTLKELERLLVSTAVDLGPAGPDHTYGYGRLDAYTAVAAANDPVPWLSVDPASGSVAPGGQTVISLTLRAAGLSTGTHAANLSITSNDPDKPAVSVPVTLTVTTGRPKISHIRVSNVRDVGASVSWITSQPAAGQVYYGTNPAELTNVAYDDRGADVQDDVHHVTISGLISNTIYYFYIASGDAVDNNEGQYYPFTTGAPLDVPASDSVYGRVLWSDGTPAANVLVYLRVLDDDGQGSLGQSGLLSALTNSDGYWIDLRTGGALNLAAVRAENGQSHFVYSDSGDVLGIEIRAGNGCRTPRQIDTANDSPAPPMTLSCQRMMEFDISPGWSPIVFPALPDPDYDAGRLLEDIAAQGGCPVEISGWLPDRGNWAGTLFDWGFPLELRPDKPYFLSTTCASRLRLPAAVNIGSREAISLTTGWNFVALPRTAGALTAEAACAQIAEQGGSVSEIDHWPADVGNWAGHICGEPFGGFRMTSDEGYFIRSQSDSTWRPSGDAEEQR